MISDSFMMNPLDGRNTKKPKTANFFVTTHISVKFFQKKAKITISFWVLVFSFMHLVSVDAKDRS